jgi:CBS-domain-containing membrane protein
MQEASRRFTKTNIVTFQTAWVDVFMESSMTKLVKDLMHPGVITCKTTATMGQVATLLHQHNVHALFVTDRDGRIAGVITDFDLMAGEWLSSDEESLTVMRKLTAADLMSHPADSVT